MRPVLRSRPQPASPDRSSATSPDMPLSQRTPSADPKRAPENAPEKASPEASSSHEDAVLIATILSSRDLSTQDLSPQDRSDAERACEALVRKYWKVLVGWVQPRVRCARDAEEIAQDAFIKAFRSLSSLQSPRSFLSWLLRITANLTTDFLRSRRRHVSLDRLSEDGQVPEMLEQRSAEQKLEQKEEVGRALAAIARLPEKYHLVLTLRYNAGITSKEIAAILDEPEGTIRNRIFRALQKAREILARQ